MAFEEGPYIQVAAFCEQVIEEKTGVLSLIRLIDVLTHTATGPEVPPEMPPLLHGLKLVLMLKSGKARGRHEVRIVPELPSGETKEPIVLSVHFEGDGRGTNVIVEINFNFTLEGLYWFKIYLGEALLTRMPFQVKYSRVVTGRRLL